jgi:hypothetical protein
VLSNEYWTGTVKVQNKNQDGSQEQARFEVGGKQSCRVPISGYDELSRVHFEGARTQKMSTALEVNREHRNTRFWLKATIFTVFGTA